MPEWIVAPDITLHEPPDMEKYAYVAGMISDEA